MRKMKLLTAELRRQIPPLGSQNDVEDPMVHCKFFTPDAGWTWYVIEGSAIRGEEEVPLAQSDPGTEDDVIFFGLVQGFDVELGTFSLRELEEVRGPLGLPIERDMYFEPAPLSVIRRRLKEGQP